MSGIFVFVLFIGFVVFIIRNIFRNIGERAIKYFAKRVQGIGADIVIFSQSVKLSRAYAINAD